LSKLEIRKYPAIICQISNKNKKIRLIAQGGHNADMRRHALAQPQTCKIGAYFVQLNSPVGVNIFVPCKRCLTPTGEYLNSIKRNTL